MDYNVFVNDKEYGPVSELTLEAWVEEGRVLSNTPLKESLSDNTYKAEELPFLANAFIVQLKHFGESPKKTIISSWSSNIINRKPKIREDLSEKEIHTYLVCGQPVSFIVRVKAAVIDIVFLVFINFILFTGVNFLIIKQIGSLNTLLYIFCAIFFSLCVIYYTLQINCFSCTLGMRIIRIKMVRKSDKNNNIFLLRAFFYTFTMFIFCTLNFIFVFILGKKRIWQDLITDISVVRIG